jgi:hypothetical protein
VNRTQTTAALVATSLGVAALLVLAACPGTATSTLYTPITGLVIDSEALLSGVGCGTASNQVFKYAAVVSLAGDAGQLPGLPVSGVFDCFSDAQFANLATPDGNLTSYVIAIYAYNQASFPAAELGACADLGSDAACQGEDPATVLKFADLANWRTTCTATQVPGVSEVAVCGSLIPVGPVGPVGDASISDEDTSAADGGTGDAAEAGDASDAGPQDAGTTGDGGTGAEAGAAPSDAGNEAG